MLWAAAQSASDVHVVVGTDVGGDGRGAWTGGIGCAGSGGLGSACTTFVPGDSDDGRRFTEFSAQPANNMTATTGIADFNTPLFC